MASIFIDRDLPAPEGTLPKLPKDLPHGLLSPPERVRELVALEKDKHPPGSLSPETLERLPIIRI